MLRASESVRTNTRPSKDEQASTILPLASGTLCGRTPLQPLKHRLTGFPTSPQAILPEYREGRLEPLVLSGMLSALTGQQVAPIVVP